MIETSTRVSKLTYGYVLRSAESPCSDQSHCKILSLPPRQDDTPDTAVPIYQPEKCFQCIYHLLAHLTIKAWEIRDMGLDLYLLTSAPPSFISDMRSLLADRISLDLNSQKQIPLGRSADTGSRSPHANEYPYANLSSDGTEPQAFDQSLMTSLPSWDWSSTSWDLWNDIVAAPKAMPDLDAAFSSGFYQGDADCH